MSRAKPTLETLLSSWDEEWDVVDILMATGACLAIALRAIEALRVQRAKRTVTKQ